MPITPPKNVINIQIVIEHNRIRGQGKEKRRPDTIRVIRETIWLRSEPIRGKFRIEENGRIVIDLKIIRIRTKKRAKRFPLKKQTNWRKMVRPSYIIGRKQIHRTLRRGHLWCTWCPNIQWLFSLLTSKLIDFR